MGGLLGLELFAELELLSREKLLPPEEVPPACPFCIESEFEEPPKLLPDEPAPGC